MIGIMLVSHGSLAQEILKIVEHVAGVQMNILSIGIEFEDDLDVHRKDLSEGIRTCEKGSGVVVFVDLYGGVPANLVLDLQKDLSFYVMGGLNVPMLLHFCDMRSKGERLEICMREAQEAARKFMDIV